MFHTYWKTHDFFYITCKGYQKSILRGHFKSHTYQQIERKGLFAGQYFHRHWVNNDGHPLNRPPFFHKRRVSYAGSYKMKTRLLKKRECFLYE